MKNRRNYYRILQVQPDADPEVIRTSYRTLMRALRQHPDLGGDHWNASILNEAYETLSDGRRRAEYDRKLFETYIKKPFPEKHTNRKPIFSIFCPFCKRPMARKAGPGESCPTCRSPLIMESLEGSGQEGRRGVARMKKSCKLRYYSSWPQKAREATMTDLSPRGVCFLSAEHLKQGTIIKLSCPLLKAVAKVTHSQKRDVDGKTMYATGAQFLTVAFSQSRGSFVSSRA